MMSEDKVTPSCGNVFEDLGLPYAEELLMKADLASEIHAAIDKQAIQEEKLAAFLEWDEADVENLLDGHISGMTVEFLSSALIRLGRSSEVRSAVGESARAKLLVESVRNDNF